MTKVVEHETYGNGIQRQVRGIVAASHAYASGALLLGGAPTGSSSQPGCR